MVQAVAPAAVPASPMPGQCWIVGMAATGAWAGRDGALAAWTAGGWRFVTPFEGMTAWSIADAMVAIRRGATWSIGEVNARQIRINAIRLLTVQQSAIATPLGGTVIDSESRTAITNILGALRTHGLVAT